MLQTLSNNAFVFIPQKVHFVAYTILT